MRRAASPGAVLPASLQAEQWASRNKEGLSPRATRLCESLPCPVAAQAWLPGMS